MIEPGTITVRCNWRKDHSFFLWGEIGQRPAVEANALKNYLFAWHRPSFYGTFIETAEQGFAEGLLLPADTALEYFCEPARLQHVDLQYGDELQQLTRLAPMIREALAARRFMPDFRKWQAGKAGWKLQLSENADAAADLLPVWQAWVDTLIAEWVRTDPDAKISLDRLQQAYPLPQKERLWENGGMDEEDWLVAIGWTTDSTPFRTGLQLVEPPEASEDWKLNVMLQDRQNKERILSWPTDPDEPRPSLPEEWEEHAARLEKDMQRWLRLLPWLQDGEPEAESGLYEPRLRTQLTHDEAWRFLTEGSLRLVQAGYTVFLPSWWERLRQRKPRLKAKLKSMHNASQPQAMFGLRQIMEFDWKLAVGDTEMDELEFRRLIEEKRRLIRFRGEWVQLDPELLEQMQRVMKRVEKKGLTFRDVLELHFLGGEGGEENGSGSAENEASHSLKLEVELNEHLRGMISHLTRSTSIETEPVPSSFQGTLRPYQNEGMSWLLFLRRFGLGGCLADDMGLGKTIQWITYLLTVKEKEHPEMPSLLICPTSVLGNWQKELQRFAPSLRVHLHYGPQRLKGKLFQEAVAGCDIVLTSYTLAHLDKTEFQHVTWNSICIDEAQNIKNAYTKQSTAIRSFEGDHRIALTGTPIENRLTELWSIFDFINPGYLGSLRDFTGQFAGAIEREKDTEKITQVQRLIRPFLLRREKRDPAIKLDLPEKNEMKVYIPLTAEQGSLYENYIQDMFERLDKLSVMERRGMILAALTRLKQLCNHPALLLKEPPSAQIAERSNKVERLLEMVAELRDEGDRCLIFTQFVETGHLLQNILQRHRKEQVQFLHGGTPKATRDEMIAHFQDESLPPDEACGIFILSLKAGGTGLNLTAANHVFHFDRWWNPAVENQATDRAFRIGQTRHVQVHKFVTLGTLEERIDEMIARKTDLSEQIVGTGESWITELSTDDLRDLFMLRSEWIDR